ARIVKVTGRGASSGSRSLSTRRFDATPTHGSIVTRSLAPLCERGSVVTVATAIPAERAARNVTTSGPASAGQAAVTKTAGSSLPAISLIGLTAVLRAQVSAPMAASVATSESFIGRPFLL